VCKQVALIDYDGLPLRPLDPHIFNECGAAPLCGVMDQVTPINNAKRRNYMNTGVIVLRPNRSVHRWLLSEAAKDADRPRARYFAEQGFFHERSIEWKHLPQGFNVQSGLLKRRWRLNFHGLANVSSSDFYLHKKFFELPHSVQTYLGLRRCADGVDPARAVAGCYVARHEAEHGPLFPRKQRENKTSAAHDLGLHKAGLHKVGLHKAGLHKAGLHKAGLDKVGLDKAGLDKVGVDKAVDLAHKVGGAGAGRGRRRRPAGISLLGDSQEGPAQPLY